MNSVLLNKRGRDAMKAAEESFVPGSFEDNISLGFFKVRDREGRTGARTDGVRAVMKHTE